jgi:hypothetical protein
MSLIHGTGSQKFTNGVSGRDRLPKENADHHVIRNIVGC